jgi:hypothetical protein
MRAAFESFPSPLMGEGAGGGEDRTPSPHPNLPPLRAEGVRSYLCQRREGVFPCLCQPPRGEYGRVMIVP